MLRIGVLVSGGGTNLQAILDGINNGTIRDAQVVTVVSNRKKAYALERAGSQGIDATWISPVSYENRDLFTQALIEHFKNMAVDLVVLAGYLVVLDQCFIEVFRNRIINIHPSLIPSFCGEGFYGLHVHEAAINRGVKITGATVHFVDEGTDTGPIIAQKAVDVQVGDTPETLQRRVMEEAEWTLLPMAINEIAAGNVAIGDGQVIIKK